MFIGVVKAYEMGAIDGIVDNDSSSNVHMIHYFMIEFCHPATENCHRLRGGVYLRGE